MVAAALLLSITTPPHGPIASAHWRASSSRTDAGRKHDHVGFQMGAIGKHHTVVSGCAIDDFSGVAAGVHMHAERFDLVAQNAPASSSTCTVIRRGANSTTWVCRPRSRSALAHSRPSRPPPTTTPLRMKWHRQPPSPANPRWCDKQNNARGRCRAPAAQRRRTGCQHQFVVSQGFTILVVRVLLRRSMLATRVFRAQSETALSQEIRRHQRQIVGTLAGKEFG